MTPQITLCDLENQLEQGRERPPAPALWSNPPAARDTPFDM